MNIREGSQRNNHPLSRAFRPLENERIFAVVRATPLKTASSLQA